MGFIGIFSSRLKKIFTNNKLKKLRMNTRNKGRWFGEIRVFKGIFGIFYESEF